MTTLSTDEQQAFRVLSGTNYGHLICIVLERELAEIHAVLRSADADNFQRAQGRAQEVMAILDRIRR